MENLAFCMNSCLAFFGSVVVYDHLMLETY